jgi:hypothetical protein
MKKVMVRFPNESFFVEFEIDFEKFIPENEFDSEIFGKYEDLYISIKK